MTLKNNRVPLLCYFKSSFCASFRSHWWIQTGVTVRKRLIWVKIKDFLAVWPWNLTDDLEKQKGISPKRHQALCIISSSYVNSNWSYSPETAMWGYDLCDLWPMTLTFCMDITSVIGNNSWKFRDDTMMGTLSKRCDGRTRVALRDLPRSGYGYYLSPALPRIWAPAVNWTRLQAKRHATGVALQWTRLPYMQPE